MEQNKSAVTFLILILIVLFVASPALVFSGTQEPEEERFVPNFDYTKYELENGFELYVLEDDSIPVISYSLYYDVGSMDDPPEKTGLAHYLEHMMFLGSKHLEAGEFSDIIEEVGGSVNAYTAFDHTVYHGEVPPAMIELIMALEAERMTNLEFDPDEIEREREVIRQERRSMVETDVFTSAMEEVQAAAFADSPLEHQVIGWMEDIESIHREDLEAHYDQHYAPDHAVMVISGDVDAEQAYALAQQYFGPLEAAGREDSASDDDEPWEFYAGEEIEVRDMTHVPIQIMLYRAPEGAHPDQAAIDMFLDILVNNRSSRVQQEVQQSQELIIETAGLNYKLEVPGYCLLYIVPADQMMIKPALNAFDAEIDGIIEDGLEEEELEMVRNTVMKQAVENQRSSEAMAELLGLGAANYGNPEFYREYVEEVYQLTENEIRDVAQKYFSPENRVTATVLPLF